MASMGVLLGLPDRMFKWLVDKKGRLVVSVDEVDRTGRPERKGSSRKWLDLGASVDEGLVHV